MSTPKATFNLARTLPVDGKFNVIAVWGWNAELAAICYAAPRLSNALAMLVQPVLQAYLAKRVINMT